MKKAYLIKGVGDVDGYRRYGNQEGYYEDYSEDLIPGPEFVYRVPKSSNRHTYTI